MISNITKIGQTRGSETRAPGHRLWGIASTLVVLMASLALAGVSSAAQFTQVLTSADFTNLGDVGKQNSLFLEHTFEPIDSIYNVNFVLLGLVVTHDVTCLQADRCTREWLAQPDSPDRTLDDANWGSTDETIRVFLSDVTSVANLSNFGDSLEVEVGSLSGDFIVLKSWIVVDFEASGGTGGMPVPSVPEPSAGLCFLVGGMILSARLRKRSRS